MCSAPPAETRSNLMGQPTPTPEATGCVTKIGPARNRLPEGGWP